MKERLVEATYLILREEDPQEHGGRSKRSVFRKRPSSIRPRLRPRPSLGGMRPRPVLATTGNAPINCNTVLHRNQQVASTLGAGANSAANIGRGATATGTLAKPQAGLFNSVSAQEIRTLGTVSSPSFTRTQSLTDIPTNQGMTNLRQSSASLSLSGSRQLMMSRDSRLQTLDSRLCASAGDVSRPGTGKKEIF